MVTTRKRAATVENLDLPLTPPKRRQRQPSPSPPQPVAAADDGYEKLRQERIKENMERMQKLGIIDLSLKLKNTISNGAGKQHQTLSPRPRGGTPASPNKIMLSQVPRRRSSRLQNADPINYSEICGKNEGRIEGQKLIVVEEGEREEVYTEEHAKLLGNCEMGWTLFVDGYGKDGKRIYDQVVGKTCHQCRQKTLGHRTNCSKCKLVQGQFCGDCLYMRYGENVLEAQKNPNWICPVCRGICNCSLCRIKKGWAPTGALYKKVVNLGYKSVAHYLIQTRQQQVNSKDTKSSAQPKSLNNPVTSTNRRDSSEQKNSLDLDDGLKLEFDDGNYNDCPKKSPTLFKAENSHPEEPLKLGNDLNSNECNGETSLQSANEHMVSGIAGKSDEKTEVKGKKGKKPAVVTPTKDCIASRVRSRADKP